jgi:hypothetical protein
MDLGAFQEGAQQQRWFHEDTAQVLMAAAKAIQLLEHFQYLPVLVPDFIYLGE